MEIIDGVLHLGPFMAVTIGIIVLFVGKRINDDVAILREFSIPEPITGGWPYCQVFNYSTPIETDSKRTTGCRPL